MVIMIDSAERGYISFLSVLCKQRQRTVTLLGFEVQSRQAGRQVNTGRSLRCCHVMCWVLLRLCWIKCVATLLKICDALIKVWTVKCGDDKCDDESLGYLSVLLGT